MSRSFYKSPYASWVCYKSDKWCRQQYHRGRRRKDKGICGRLVGDIYEDDDLDGCYRSEEDFVNANIDRSLRFADKYCWDSDGGKYYRGGLEDCRKDFDEEVFTSREKHGVKHTPIWENYKSYVEKVFNKEKPEYTVRLKRKVVKKIDFGFYMPWGFFDEPSYETEKKYIKTTIYPPRFKPEDGWEIDTWWRIKRYPSFSNWNLFGFMFKSGIIPLDFKNENELIDWLRENEESIIRKWLKAKYLRK